MGAPGQPAMAPSPSSMIARNLEMRSRLLATAPRERKYLGNFTQGGSAGGTTRVKLFNVGITTKLVLDVTMTFDIGTAVTTAGPKSPWNLINRIKLTDFDNTDRVNCTGYQLWLAQCIRDRTVYGYNNESQTAVLTSPLVPTAVATGTIMRFQIEVPLAYDEFSDLRGALLTQSAVGESTLTIDWASAAGILTNANDDSVYNGGATATVANVVITTNVFQEYLFPQSVGGQVPIPELDLMTVYELAGGIQSSDNIAANAEKLINYPNQRSVLGLYVTFTNNGVMNPATTDISKFRLLANGNNVLREYLPTDKLFDQRMWLAGHGDLRKGTYFELHRQKPIDTALYGNFQYGITPSSVSGTNTHMDFMFESFFTKGQSLPGFSQSS